MSVPFLFHTTTISRKQKVEGKGISSQYVQVATGVKCLVLPQTEDFNVSRDYIYGQDYVAIFNPNTDIKGGDKLVTSTGLELLVSGTANYKDVPIVSHIQVACTTEGV